MHAFIVCVFLACAQPQPTSAPGASAAAAPAATNAALLYMQAWLLESSQTVTQVQEEICRPGADCQMDGAWMPSDDLAKDLLAEQRVIERLLAAAGAEHCDFGIDFRGGPDVLLPHLGRLRSSARLLAADSVRALAAGDHAGAAERAVAIYAISRHAVDDHTLIASLVSDGISRIGANAVERLCAGKLAAPARRRIADAVRRSDPADPTCCRRGLAGERAMLAAWFGRFTGSDAGAKLGRSTLVTDMGPSGAEVAAALTPLDEAGVRAMASDYLAFMDALLETWDKPDAADAHKALIAKARAGDFGLFAKACAGSLGSLCATRREAVRGRARTLEMLAATP